MYQRGALDPAVNRFSYDGSVCIDEGPGPLAAAVRHDVEPALEIDLEPVDSVVILVRRGDQPRWRYREHAPA